MKRYSGALFVLFAGMAVLLVYAGIIGQWLTFAGAVAGWLFGVALLRYQIAKRINAALIQQIGQQPELLAQLIAAQQPKQPEGQPNGVPAV